MSVRVLTQDGVATIEIARPEKRNALTQAMYREMAGAIRAADADEAVQALVLMGQGEVFCAGNDLEDFQQVPESIEHAPVGELMRALIECEKPIVAAVCGAAVGIGATMLLHCDFVYLSDSAQLVFPFVALGLVPEFGSTLLLAQRIGHPRAARALMLGEPIGAAAAVEWGLATVAFPAAEVLQHALGVARRFNGLSAQAVRRTKSLMRAGERAGLREAMAAENAAFLERLRSPEVQAGLRAFLDRRAGAGRVS